MKYAFAALLYALGNIIVKSNQLFIFLIVRHLRVKISVGEREGGRERGRGREMKAPVYYILCIKPRDIDVWPKSARGEMH